MARDFRHDTEAEQNMRTSSPVSELVLRIRYCVGNPSAWDAYDEGKSELFREAVIAITTLSTRNAELEREVKRLREALEFYADKSKYPAPFTGGFGKLYFDCGQVADAALSTSPREASMSEIKLLPCPFCGKAMMLRGALWPAEGDRDGIIHAEPTDCLLQSFENDTFDESIIIEWNRRAALSSAAVAEREPVVIRYRWSKSNGSYDNWIYTDDIDHARDLAADDGEVQSLYIDPPPTSELEAENARLRDERGEYRRKWEQACSMGHLQAEAAEARLAEAMKALEPFADIADLIDSETEGMSETDELALHFHDYLMASWPVALFRAARRVREGGKVDG